MTYGFINNDLSHTYRSLRGTAHSTVVRALYAGATVDTIWRPRRTLIVDHGGWPDGLPAVTADVAVFTSPGGVVTVDVPEKVIFILVFSKVLDSIG